MSPDVAPLCFFPTGGVSVGASINTKSFYNRRNNNMSKKKKLKYYNGSKKKKKSGKKNSSAYKRPKYKDIKSTLSKKEAKENKKIVLSPVDVPKEFRKNRLKCNHAGDLVGVDKYKAMTPNYAAYTPFLDQTVAKFGEDHVHICQSCYDVIVDRTCVDSEDVIDAMTTLYAAVNVAVANRRMKDDEVKELSKLKERLDDFRPVVEILSKLEEDERDRSSDSGRSGSNLNSNSGASFIG